ncbi:MAG: helix-turn-helix domain-containing protein [Proteobacteria bacterium]|nr:helix-turn-helix domain-containing protein [Pseudomonadota bacterium]
MSNITIVPKSFKEQPTYNLIELDDFSGVIFRPRKELRKQEVYATCHLFVVVLSGEKVVHTPEGDFHIRSGNAFMVRRGLHMFSEIFAEEHQYKSLIFFIDDRLLADFFRTNALTISSPAPGVQPKNIFQIPVSPLMRAGIDATLPFFSNKAAVSKELLKVKLTEILLHIAQSKQGTEFLSFVKGLQSHHKKDLLPLMEENFARSFSVKHFAELSGRSLTTFKKDFRNTFQQSPQKWINEKRLERARFLLTHTDLNVTDVCFEVGFENLSYFGQLFKKRFGTSPKKITPAQNPQK